MFFILLGSILTLCILSAVIEVLLEVWRDKRLNTRLAASVKHVWPSEDSGHERVNGLCSIAGRNYNDYQ